jgi:pyrroline-5-carboxylate reductase
MAGKTLRFLEGALGDCAIVRSIPNTPPRSERGITVAVPNARVARRSARTVAHAAVERRRGRMG